MKYDIPFVCMQAASGRPLVSLWEGYADPAAWLVLLWSAVGPGALAAFLQTQATQPIYPCQLLLLPLSRPAFCSLPFATCPSHRRQ